MTQNRATKRVNHPKEQLKKQPFFSWGSFQRDLRACCSKYQREQGPDVSKGGDTSELPCSYSQEERRYNPTAHHSWYIQGSICREDQSNAVSISGFPPGEQFPPQEVLRRLLRPSQLTGEALPSHPTAGTVRPCLLICKYTGRRGKPGKQEECFMLP